MCNYCGGSGTYQTWDKQSGRTDEVQCVCWQRVSGGTSLTDEQSRALVMERIRKQFGEKAFIKQGDQ
jgi:hypothetical protein